MAEEYNNIFDDKHFRTLIENSADAIQVVTPEGKVLYSSDSIKLVLGYTPREILGVNVAPYIHPDDLPHFMNKLQKILAKPLNSITLEYRVNHKNGEYVWVETTVTNHLETPGINAIVGNFRNITERKRSEESLRESERQFRLLSDLSPVAITVHAGGKILYLNQAGAKMIGAKKPEEIVGQPIARFVHPDYLPAVAERVKIIMEENKPTPLFREKFVRLDGSEIDVDVISIPITYNEQKAIQVVIRDVTEEKKALEALKESEQRLRFMAESMPQKIFTADADGKVDYVNPQWLEFTGKTFKKMIGDGWGSVVHPDELRSVLKLWKHSIATGEPFSLEMRYRSKDGSYRWHITRAQAMRDEQGSIVRWFGSNTDIDDIKASLQREDTLEKRAQQLVELNKAKDEFIALASHQLRTPATAVKQFLGMVLQGYAGELNDTQIQMITQANESNDRQIDIINDLLHVARLDGGTIKLDKVPCSIATVLEDSIDEIRQTLNERNQQIEIVRTKSAKKITADISKLQMVFENILGNASKYSYEGTTIKTAVKYDKKWAYVTIQDEGVGIAKENIEKLFKKFSRIDNPLSLTVGGTGLGLYWALKVIEMHDGTIDVESKLGEGTKFIVKIPLLAV